VSPLSWTGKQLALFWLAAAFASATLVALGAVLMPEPHKFFWLLPAPSGPLGAARLAIDVVWHFFSVRPFETTALVGVPAAALAVTIAWALARVFGRGGGGRHEAAV
jgi:hypothetical protein